MKNGLDIKTFRENPREPDFQNLIKVFKRENPTRPTLFEFGLNQHIYDSLTADIGYASGDPLLKFKKMADAFRIAGYDFVCIGGSGFHFKTKRKFNVIAKTFSQNEYVTISDWADYERYEWPEPENYDYSVLDKIAGYLPDGMKIIICDSLGVLETVIDLAGYENLCLMLNDEPELVKQLFNQVGSRLLKYHQICAGYEIVGAHLFGDDWGFNTQTFISHNDMRKYVLPWHKKQVLAVHSAGKFAILHSCGNLTGVMEDVVGDLQYDAKHSFEDSIQPVEEAYKKYRDKIAILGGIDVDFLCRAPIDEIYNRSTLLLEKCRTGYALGSGNSIPDYVPIENFLTMNAAALYG